MPIPGGYIRCERGTLVFPWGKNKNTIEVLALMPAKESVEVIDFSGPNMDGYPNNATARPVNTILLRGRYVAADTTAMIARAGMRGTMTAQLGNGETWDGKAILVSSSAKGSFGIEAQGNEDPKNFIIEMELQFTGKVTRTPISAGV